MRIVHLRKWLSFPFLKLLRATILPGCVSAEKKLKNTPFNVPFPCVLSQKIEQANIKFIHCLLPSATKLNRKDRLLYVADD